MAYKIRYYTESSFGVKYVTFVVMFHPFYCRGRKNVQCVYKIMVRFQKLTRNLILILHGQNLHRQQRQLSKFFAH
jgi:hypothetical protein